MRDHVRATTDWPQEVLQSLGYEFTNASALAEERLGVAAAVSVTQLRAAILRLNGPLDDRDVERAIRKITRPAAERLTEANEQVHRALLGEVRVIDFEEPSNNEFTFARGLQVRSRHGNVTADLVVFVNGLPLAVVECATARLGESIETAIGQLVRNQQIEERIIDLGSPRLFQFAQVLIAVCGQQVRYATVGTPAPSWGTWKASATEPTVPTETSALAALLEKGTLLELVRDFVVFHAGANGRDKKLARHAQFVGVNRVMEHVAAARQPAARGGVVFQAHGSGKSFTMLFLAAKLQRLVARTGGMLVVVSDRKNLRDTMATMFAAAGHPVPTEPANATEMLQFLSRADGRTAVSSVARFQKALCGRRPFAGGGRQAFVIVDEAFRSEERRLTIDLRRALPDACLLGFTGTPVEKSRSSTVSSFGPYIHKYTAEQAIADGAIVPVYYEKRRPLVDTRREAFLRLLKLRDQRPARGEGAFGGASKEAPEGPAGAPSRVALVCVDLLDHFVRHVRPSGFKAQIVVKNRETAAEVKETLDALGVSESAIVISALRTDPEHLVKWHTTKEEQQAVLARFKDPKDPLALLVVCDLLLTDFDAGVEQVMYIDAPLRDRWIQATARVNRVAEGKAYGLVVDYSASAKHVERALRAGHLALTSHRPIASGEATTELEAEQNGAFSASPSARVQE